MVLVGMHALTYQYATKGRHWCDWAGHTSRRVLYVAQGSVRRACQRMCPLLASGAEGFGLLDKQGDEAWTPLKAILGPEASGPVDISTMSVASSEATSTGPIQQPKSQVTTIPLAGGGAAADAVARQAAPFRQPREERDD